MTTKGDGRFKKGEKKPNQGKRGPGKVTKALKDSILSALDKVGGEDYLVQQATENPTAFLTLIGKVLPTTLAGDPQNPFQQIVKVELVGMK